MWHKPQLMTAVSDLLFAAAAAALLVAAAVWTTRLPLFPLRELVVMHELQEVRRAEIERATAGMLRGNFFSINLDALRQSLERLPWVRRAEVRRQWPARIEVRIEEHRPAARWGDAPAQLVNTHGEVFSAVLSRDLTLPVLNGPAGLSAEMLQRHAEFSRALQPLGLRLEQITLSPRLAWQLRLDDGLLVELGREQSKASIGMRLARFVEYYPTVTDPRHAHPLAVDMRYPNGFVLRFAGGTGHEARGKQ